MDEFSRNRRCYRSAKIGMLREMGATLSGSWHWAAPGFERQLELLLAPGGLDGAECIWKTRHKEVWKVRLETPEGPQYVIYKSKHRFRPIFYACHYSQNAREAANYRALEALGMPMAQLLGCGDFRRGRILDRSFLVTRFAEGFRDGRAFAPGGPCADDVETRDEFLRRNLRLLAKMHEAHCTHRGFIPNNLLWRKQQDGSLELLWIDVASAFYLPLPEFLFSGEIARDLAFLFAPLKLEEEKRMELLRYYLSVNRRTRLTQEQLARRTDAVIARR